MARRRAAAWRVPGDRNQRLHRLHVREILRSRSGALLGALSVSTVATGVMFIAVPLELRSLHAGPSEIGVTLAIFGLGTFLFEWVWGAIADRVGYRGPLISWHHAAAETPCHRARSDLGGVAVRRRHRRGSRRISPRAHDDPRRAV